MKTSRKDIAAVIETLLTVGSHKATKFVAPDHVITATRKCYGGKIDGRDKSIDIVLKIGKPNYAEREFIKKCKQAKEPFPVKKIQLKFFKK